VEIFCQNRHSNLDLNNIKFNIHPYHVTPLICPGSPIKFLNEQCRNSFDAKGSSVPSMLSQEQVVDSYLVARGPTAPGWAGWFFEMLAEESNFGTSGVWNDPLLQYNALFLSCFPCLGLDTVFSRVSLLLLAFDRCH